jgi:hypothetical protein
MNSPNQIECIESPFRAFFSELILAEVGAARNAILGTHALSTAGHRIAKPERLSDQWRLNDRRTQLE